MPAAVVWLQIPEFLPLQIRAGSDHQTDYSGKRGRKRREVLEEYADPTSDRYESMCQEICRRQNFTSLRYHRLDDLVESIGLPKCKCVPIALTEKNKQVIMVFKQAS